jgi:sugar fermentation stimulation protein A
MKLPVPLLRGRLLRRYKRFLADVALPDGTTVTAHCPNSGSMLGVCAPGSEIWLSRTDGRGRRFPHTWELVRADGALVGINTGRPNRLVEEAVGAGTIKELAGYATLRREVRYGRNSRIDLMLESADRPPCLVEVKNVTLKRGDAAEFPDAVTARGSKHLEELSAVARDGGRAVMAFLVQRGDCARFRVAGDIDPAYATALRRAVASGVEVLCYDCFVTPRSIAVRKSVTLDFDAADGLGLALSHNHAGMPGAYR